MKKKNNKKEEDKFKVNRFYWYADGYREKAVPDSDIKNDDMTNEFWREIESEIKNDELVNININAKVRMSKSTTAIYLAMTIHKMLVNLGKASKMKFSIRNIARDQQEYSKIMRNPDINRTVIVTDEINELEETGENVTVEKALNNVFSNVQAGRYVHRISCSPRDVADPNADIFLEIIGVDRVKKITRANLYYKMLKGGDEYLQLLGYVDFNVSPLLKIWDRKVRQHFFKAEPTEEDNKIVDKYRKKDIYTEYMIRKYEKMDLINREGIMKPRLLDYAGVILEVEDKLRKLTRMNILNRGTVKNYIKMYCREHKIPTSIIGQELMAEEVLGILNLWKSWFKVNRDLEKAKLRNNEGDIKQLIEMKTELKNTIDAQREELLKYKEIQERYDESKFME